MKAIKKHVIFILSAAIITALFLIPQKANAESKTYSLITLDKMTSITVNITYETDDVEFYLISPEGIKVDSQSEDYEVYIVKFEKITKMIVINADAGEWKLVYDKGSNDSIGASVEEYSVPLEITDFSISNMNEDSIEISINTFFNSDIRFDYEISLMLYDDSTAKRVMDSGSMNANRQYNKKISLKEVNSYDEYVLRLDVYYGQDMQSYNFAYSEKFSYDNKIKKEAVEDVSIIFNLTENNIIINWENSIPRRADAVNIDIFDNNEEKIFSEYFQQQENCQYTFITSPEYFRIEFTYAEDGLISEKKNFEYKKENLIFKNLNMESEEPVDSTYYYMDYESEDEVTAEITINGETEFYTFNGIGSLGFDINEGNNRLFIKYSLESIEINVDKDLIVDINPPILNIYEEYEGMEVDTDSIIIAGSTDNNAEVYINGKSVLLDEDGIFTHEVMLSGGENIIVVTAADRLGNTAKYEAYIYKTNGLKNDDNNNEETNVANIIKNYLPFLITIIISLVCIVILLIKSKRKSL